MSSDEETSTIHYSMEEMEDAPMPSPPAHRPLPPVAPAPVPPPPPQARPPTEATSSEIEGGHPGSTLWTTSPLPPPIPAAGGGGQR